MDRELFGESNGKKPKGDVISDNNRNLEGMIIGDLLNSPRCRNKR